MDERSTNRTRDVTADDEDTIIQRKGHRGNGLSRNCYLNGHVESIGWRMGWSNVRERKADRGKDEAGTGCGGGLMLGSVLVEGKKEVDEEILGGCKQDTRAGPGCGGSLTLGRSRSRMRKDMSRIL